IQETVLRTLPDSADGSAEAGRAETAAAGSAQPKRSATVASEADSAPSRLPSDQEIRSTVHEDSPSEGTSDDTDQRRFGLRVRRGSCDLHPPRRCVLSACRR